MTEVACPCCRTVFDTEERCSEERGMYRCVDRAGHVGPHWADTGGGRVVRWDGFMRDAGCGGRLGDRWCDKEPGHEGMHFKDGLAWVEDELPVSL